MGPEWTNIPSEEEVASKRADPLAATFDPAGKAGTPELESHAVGQDWICHLATGWTEDNRRTR